MRAALPLPARPASHSREKPLPVYGTDWTPSSRTTVERPPSIREAIARWLNEEL